MFLNNKLCQFVLVLSMLLLAGCASNESKPANGKDGGAATTSTTSGSASNETSAQTAGTADKTTAAPKPAVVVANPTIIPFEKMSITLDDKNKALVAQIVDRAKSASKIVITGFCDRKQIGNSENSAIARSVVVRDELIAQGVMASKIQVKFSTKVAKKHAAEVKFD